MFMGRSPLSGGKAGRSWGGRSGQAFAADEDDVIWGGMAAGLAAGSLVSTPEGWRPVEGVVEGDHVMTFDGGMQRVKKVCRGVLWRADGPCPKPLWPLFAPVDALGNDRSLVLLPEQCVLVESDLAEALYADPFALMPATALDGVLGITRMPPQAAVDVVSLAFQRDEIVYVNGAALIFCPVEAAGNPVPLDRLPGAGALSAYDVLCGEAARLVARELQDIAGRETYAA